MTDTSFVESRAGYSFQKQLKQVCIVKVFVTSQIKFNFALTYA